MKAFRDRQHDTIMAQKRAKFEILSDMWIEDTKYHSSISIIQRHPNFKRITSDAEIAIRFSLEKLKAGDIHVHWFLILGYLVDYDPVPYENRGCLPEMATAWVKWGKDVGRIEN